MRALKLLATTVVFVMLIFSSQQAQAQGCGCYDIGPLTAEGIGDTPAEAMAMAQIELWDMVALLYAVLPPNHTITGWDIVIEGYIDPTYYIIDFTVHVEWYEELPPLPNK